MGEIVEIGRRRPFSLAEADELLPVVWRISQHYKTQIEDLTERLEGAKAKSIRERIETLMQKSISMWQSKMRRLGGRPRGLWIVDFDSGDGYFCWRFPEPEILFWHEYEDGFSKRKCVKRGLAPAVWVVSQSAENAVPVFR